MLIINQHDEEVDPPVDLFAKPPRVPDSIDLPGWYSVLLPAKPPTPKNVKTVRPCGFMQAQREKRTHCRRGHPLREDNIYWRRNGTVRECRTCHLAAQRASRRARRGGA